MKKLLESWNRFLTEDFSKIESMIDALGDNAVSVEKSGKNISVSFIDSAGGIPLSGPSGGLMMHKANIAIDGGRCLNAWVITYSEAKGGFGPLLYDVAIEFASLDPNSSGLTADRSSVTKDAFKVWEKYLTIRPDVNKVQLDDLKNTLTPDDQDNCDSDSAKIHPPFSPMGDDEDSDEYKQDLPQRLKDSAIMKVYSKQAQPAMSQLVKAGKFYYNGVKRK